MESCLRRAQKAAAAETRASHGPRWRTRRAHFVYDATIASKRKRARRWPRRSKATCCARSSPCFAAFREARAGRHDRAAAASCRERCWCKIGIRSRAAEGYGHAKTQKTETRQANFSFAPANGGFVAGVCRVDSRACLAVFEGLPGGSGSRARLAGLLVPRGRSVNSQPQAGESFLAARSDSGARSWIFRRVFGGCWAGILVFASRAAGMPHFRLGKSGRWSAS